MRPLKILLAAISLVWLAACSFESQTILPDIMGGGDAIPGLPTDAAFRLESFDRDKGAFNTAGTMTPEKLKSGKIRYIFALSQDSGSMAVHARKLGDNAYVLRYAEMGHPEPGASDTALVFLTIEDGTYYLLTSLADKAMFDKVYAGRTRPALVNDVITFSDDAGAEWLAGYFSSHRADFRMDQDYIRMRLEK